MSFIRRNRMFSAPFRQGVAVLSNEELATYAPSVLATAAHESRSEKFRPIATMEVVNGMRKAGFVPVSAQQSGTRDITKRGFTKHLIRFRRVQDMENPGLRRVGGTFPEAVLVNANDGTSSYKLYSGLFRIICLNGMVSMEEGGQEVRVGHRGSQEDVIRKVIEGTFEVLGTADKTMDAAEQWSGIRVGRDHALAFAEAAHTLRFDDPAATPIKPAQLLQVRRNEDSAPSAWNVFNVVQENVIKGGLTGTMVSPNTGRARQVRTGEVNGIDQNVKLNRALWLLGARFAELAAR